MLKRLKQTPIIVTSIFCFLAALICALLSWNSQRHSAPVLEFFYQPSIYGYEQYQGHFTVFESDARIQAVALQAFYDLGSGFNPTNVSTFSPPEINRWTKVRMEIPKVGIQRIRLDPARTAGEFRFKELRLIDAQGDVRLTIPIDEIRAINQIASREERDEELWIKTTADAPDPMLEILIGSGLDLRLSKGQQLELLGTTLLWWCALWAGIAIGLRLIFLALTTTSFTVIAIAIPLFVSLSLVGFSWTVIRVPIHFFDDVIAALENSCGLQHQVCRVLTKPLHGLRFGVRRISVLKSDLPVFDIQISDGALIQIQRLRERTLDAVRPIYLPKDGDWVKASIIFDDGRTKQKKKAWLRLKGRFVADHWSDPRKLSMRIKVRDGGSIMGMTKFSIQSASQRHYQYEPLMLNMMRRVGVVAPRYVFVDARLNGQVVGVMALEEHFTKEMLEFNNRREGPVVAIDMEWMWEQADQNYNKRNGSRDRETNLFTWDYPIKAYQAGAFDPDTTRGRNTQRAMSLLRDYRDAELRGSDSFDLDTLSRWWIMVNIWQTWHSLEDHNRRNYFNPVTGRLEPIAYDNASWLGLDQTWKLLVGDDIESVLADPTFQELTFKNIDSISEMLDSIEFRTWFTEQHKVYVDLISIDGAIAPRLSIHHLEQSLRRFVTDVDHLFLTANADSLSLTAEVVTGIDGSQSKQASKQTHNDPVRPSQFSQNDRLLVRHIRPFWFWSEGNADIEIKNLTSYPIVVNSIYKSGQPKKNMLNEMAGVHIPASSMEREGHLFKMLQPNFTDLTPNDKLMVDYWYRGTQYTRPLLHQFRNYYSGYAGDEATNSWLKNNNISIDSKRRELTFPMGAYQIDSRIETQPGWAVKFLPGVRLTLTRGGILKINGALLSLGSETQPVTISINSSVERGVLGTWGGILVTDSGDESILEHTHVIGTLTRPLPNSQDSYGLTGCVTFHNSRLLVKNSLFSNVQCEDALNIVNSKFKLINSKFVDIRSDALDSDFSSGSVKGSSFSGIGGDGIDLAGSVVEVNSTQLTDISDKAFSVGERSVANISNALVNQAGIGIASKDQSLAMVKDSYFNDIHGTTLMAYIKKEEYGPAELHCNGCYFDQKQPDVAEQFGSEITVDGKRVAPKIFSPSQLYSKKYTQ